MKNSFLFQVFAIIYISTWLNQTTAQIKSGPMLGYVELRTAKIWCELIPQTSVELLYWPTQDDKKVNKAFKTINKFLSFETVLFDLVQLEPGTQYSYQIIYNKKIKENKYSGTFMTQELWQWRKPAPDFTVLTGSCSYINEPIYDRPGRAYGTDSIIFQALTKEKAAMMVWLGDNWYTREVDYSSEWGLWYRSSRDRAIEIKQELWKNMSHVGIWDDHDYGPNDEGVSYIFKNESRNVFKSYFANPTYGMDNKGIYTKVSYNDVDFFLLDNRTWRSSDDMPDTKEGRPNPEKRMYGQEQLHWLKNALLNSQAAFKIIVTGSQVLNALSPFDCLSHFPIEKEELLNFLNYSKVNGVIFLTGDRHFSEINKLDRDSLYTLYDITVSSLTAGISKVSKEEKNNPNRVNNFYLEDHNYGRLSFSGEKKERKLKIEFVDKNGITKGSYEINAASLKNKK